MVVVVLFCTLSTVLFWMSPRAALAGTSRRAVVVAGSATDPTVADYWQLPRDGAVVDGASGSGSALGLPGIGMGGARGYLGGGNNNGSLPPPPPPPPPTPFRRPDVSSARGAACYTACCTGIPRDILQGAEWREDDRSTRAIRPFDELDHGGAQPRHRILTPQWLPGVDAAIIFSLDDFATKEDVFGIVPFTNVKALADSAVTRDLRGGLPGSGLVIFTRGLPSGSWTKPESISWVADGVEFGAHTTAHSCPIYMSGCASVLRERRRAALWQTLMAAGQYMAARPLCFR
jgi:hypothetical protein